MNVRFWDQEFERWNNNGAPMDDPYCIAPGKHPMEGHPWNLGMDGKRHYLKLLGLDPTLMDLKFDLSNDEY